MTGPESILELGDSVQDALLPSNDPSRAYEEATNDALLQKERQLDAKSHRKKLLGWLSYAFARCVYSLHPRLFSRLTCVGSY